MQCAGLEACPDGAARALVYFLNIDNHQLSRIEEAQINTSILMAYSLAKALEVELGVLMTVGE